MKKTSIITTLLLFPLLILSQEFSNENKFFLKTGLSLFKPSDPSLGFFLGASSDVISYKNTTFSAGISIYYQTYQDNQYFPASQGLMTPNSDGTLVLIGAHDAYTLKRDSQFSFVEIDFKVKSQLTEKLTMNFSPYFTYFIFGSIKSDTYSQRTVFDDINGNVVVSVENYVDTQNRIDYDLDPVNKIGYGLYFGFDYDLSDRIRLNLRTPLMADKSYGGMSFNGLFELAGSVFHLAFEYRI